jgi:hypothetical protein
MMAMTVQETLTALYKELFKGLALFGCGLAGIALTTDDLEDL